MKVCISCHCSTCCPLVACAYSANKDLNRDFPDAIELGAGHDLSATGKEQPETLAVMQWSLSKQFVASASFHEVSSRTHNLVPSATPSLTTAYQAFDWRSAAALCVAQCWAVKTCWVSCIGAQGSFWEHRGFRMFWNGKVHDQGQPRSHDA